jgi:hypothetical protein
MPVIALINLLTTLIFLPLWLLAMLISLAVRGRAKTAWTFCGISLPEKHDTEKGGE